MGKRKLVVHVAEQVKLFLFQVVSSYQNEKINVFLVILLFKIAYMKKQIIIVLFLTSIFSFSVKAQSYSVNSNQQQININVPVIEKPVYIEKYRTVYVNKPRVARKLEKPVLLLGYLWVYPEDLGNFKQIPIGVINSVNAQNPYGRNNWRLPTPDELAVMEANGEIIGLGNDIYLATDHCNGVLRLVSTEGEYTNCVKIGNTYWSKSNLGTTTDSGSGMPLTYQEALNHAPSGYRLPTENEMLSLVYSGLVRFGDLTEGNSLIVPYTSERTTDRSYSSYYTKYGQYWIQGGKSLYFSKCIKSYGFNQHETTIRQPEIQETSEEKCYVRYVMDK